MRCPSPNSLVLALALSFLSTAFAEVSTPAYLDISQPVDARVADLVSRLTIDEKAGLNLKPVSF